MTQDEFLTFVKEHLITVQPHAQEKVGALEADTDMIGSGAIDSFTFIDLCLAIEQKTGVMIDFAELEPGEFTSIEGLYKLTQSKAGAAA